MAKSPIPAEESNAQFGPHLQLRAAGRLAGESRHPRTKLVKTHCCFCGQQCGIQLKVRDNR